MPSYQRGHARNGRHLTDAEIVELYAAGADALSIGMRAGCCDTTVRNLVRAAGGVVRPRGGRPRRALLISGDEIVRLYRSGLGGVELADRAGCAPGTIYRVLRESGVHVRPSFAASKADRQRRRQPF